MSFFKITVLYKPWAISSQSYMGLLVIAGLLVAISSTSYWPQGARTCNRAPWTTSYHM